MHAMWFVWTHLSSEEKWGFIFIYARNAFNKLNCTYMLWMLRKLCPYITLFALLPIGHGEIWVSSSPPHPITARVFFWCTPSLVHQQFCQWWTVWLHIWIMVITILLGFNHRLLTLTHQVNIGDRDIEPRVDQGIFFQNGLQGDLSKLLPGKLDGRMRSGMTLGLREVLHLYQQKFMTSQCGNHLTPEIIYRL